MNQAKGGRQFYGGHAAPVLRAHVGWSGRGTTTEELARGETAAGSPTPSVVRCSRVEVADAWPLFLWTLKPLNPLRICAHAVAGKTQSAAQAAKPKRINLIFIGFLSSFQQLTHCCVSALSDHRDACEIGLPM